MNLDNLAPNSIKEDFYKEKEHRYPQHITKILSSINISDRSDKLSEVLKLFSDTCMKDNLSLQLLTHFGWDNINKIFLRNIEYNELIRTINNIYSESSAILNNENNYFNQMKKEDSNSFETLLVRKPIPLSNNFLSKRLDSNLIFKKSNCSNLDKSKLLFNGKEKVNFFNKIGFFIF